MRFVVDDQLPVYLARLMRGAGLDAHHLSEIGLKGADDGAIWHAALDKDRIIVTKDADFVARMRGRPPHARVLWLRCGNLRNPELGGWIAPKLAGAAAAFARGDALVELA